MHVTLDHSGKLQVDEVCLSYRLRGSGPPLVLISGLGYGAWFWEGLVPHLSPHVTVLTFDNRGAGDSDKPAGPYTTRGMAQDVAGLLKGLELPSAWVLGHSLGGFIAQELALGWPERVRGLILCSTTCGGADAVPIAPQALQVMLDRSGDPRALFERGIRVATAPGFMTRCPEQVEALWDYRKRGPVPPLAYAAQVQAGAAHDASARLHDLTLPVLILSGDADQVVPSANVQVLKSHIPQAQPQLLPGLGHLFPLEDPLVTCDALLAWLEHAGTQLDGIVL